MTESQLLASAPVGFTPTGDFWSDEFQSQYVAGLLYTIQPGNMRLARAVEGWLKDGNVKLAETQTAATPPARMYGAGQIS